MRGWVSGRMFWADAPFVSAGTTTVANPELYRPGAGWPAAVAPARCRSWVSRLQTIRYRSTRSHRPANVEGSAARKRAGGALLRRDVICTSPGRATSSSEAWRSRSDALSGESFDLGCRRTYCAGRVIDPQTVTINLHNLDPACSVRCRPNLTSVVASLARRPGRELEVTVPVFQYGDARSPGASDRSSGEAVYRVRREPIAYLDVSIEFQ
jgi:hypothetical protein